MRIRWWWVIPAALIVLALVWVATGHPLLFLMGST